MVGSDSAGMPHGQEDESLLKLYTPVFALVSTSRAAGDYGDPSKLADKTIQLLLSVQNKSQDLGKNSNWVADAQYAVVAFVDESIRSSNWEGRSKWIADPLAMRLGLNPHTGEQFFTRLESWLRRDNPPLELLEVFYMCLGLGFRGKYFSELDRLTDLKKAMLQFLKKLEYGIQGDSRLSPNALRGTDDSLEVFRDSLPWTWMIAGSLGFLLLLFAILKLCSIGEIRNLVDRLV